MLENPDPENWLLWRRTYDAAGYSPLRQITPANVGGLRPAWSWSLPPGPSESTPIVHDGVLFVHGFGDKVHALDAAGGDLLWEYARRLPRDVAPSLKRGMSIYGERLYVPASDLHVVALDVKTGAVEWEQQVVGPGERVRLTGGKQAIFDVVETGTGKYVTSIDLGLQNSITGINPTTGEKIVDPRSIPGDGETKMVCPHVGGGRSWAPTAYDPGTKIVYVPITEACMDMVPVGEGERGSLTTGVRWTVRPRPESDGNYGRVEAFNLETQETVWIARLWATRLSDVPNSPPITFAVDGRQYVAATTGAGGYLTGAYSVMAPEIRNPTDRSATLWVFEVAEP